MKVARPETVFINKFIHLDETDRTVAETGNAIGLRLLHAGFCTSHQIKKKWFFIGIGESINTSGNFSTGK